MKGKDQIKCPSCRRGYQIEPIRTELARCSRCECELEDLVNIHLMAYNSLSSGWNAVQNYEFRQALSYAEQAWMLVKLEESIPIGLISSVMMQHTPNIRKWLQRGHQS